MFFHVVFCYFVIQSLNVNSFNINSHFTMLNRILFKSEEVVNENKMIKSTSLKLSYMDTRAQHIGAILRCRDGDKVKIGILNHGIENHAKIKWIWPNGYNNSWEDGRDNIDEMYKSERRKIIDKMKITQQKINPIGLELILTQNNDSILHNINKVRPKESKPNEGITSNSSLGNLNSNQSLFSLKSLPYPPSRVDLILALPRPQQLKRMLPMISQIGVGKIILTNANKVEPCYFKSHLLINSTKHKNNNNNSGNNGNGNMNLLEDLLIEGLVQSGDIIIPKVDVIHNFTSFLTNQLNDYFPLNNTIRILAHPNNDEIEKEMNSSCQEALHNHYMSDIPQPMKDEYSSPSRIVVAIGPEGGWTEDEVDLLTREYHFIKVDVGPRILRSDVAVVTLLSLAHEKIRKWDLRDRRED